MKLMTVAVATRALLSVPVFCTGLTANQLAANHSSRSHR
jgi:hypothetical protein